MENDVLKKLLDRKIGYYDVSKLTVLGKDLEAFEKEVERRCMDKAAENFAKSLNERVKQEDLIRKEAEQRGYERHKKEHIHIADYIHQQARSEEGCGCDECVDKMVISIGELTNKEELAEQRGIEKGKAIVEPYWKNHIKRAKIAAFQAGIAAILNDDVFLGKVEARLNEQLTKQEGEWEEGLIYIGGLKAAISEVKKKG